jgi:hypothetical protein
MKWYKHLSKSIDNPFIRELMYEFGADAYLVFFGTLEIYADNFVPSERYELSVKTRYLRDKLLLSTSKLQKIFKKISQNPDKESQWEINFNNDQVIIFIPKFKKLLDNYTSDNLQETSKKLPSDKEETFQAIRIKNKDKRIKNKENRGIWKIPTLQEISDYCMERKNKINAQYFLDYQIARDWKLKGGQKIKDWKAVIRTWEKNDFDKAVPAARVIKDDFTWCKKCGARRLKSDVDENGICSGRCENATAAL